MADTNVFALKKLGVDLFLAGEVGIELSGSPLTILSTLARLGEDPWGRATQWSNASRSKAIEGLTADIIRMPLRPSDLINARATATRLVDFLPRQSNAETTGHPPTGRAAVPHWVVIVLLPCSLALGLAISMAVHATHSAAPPPHSDATTPSR